MEEENDSCLLFDTSNRWILIALKKRGKGSGGWESHVEEAPRSCFQILPGLIQRLCQNAGIDKADWLICTTGPGSFTGTRLGVAFARNLSQLWQVPVMGILSPEFYSYTLLWERKDIEELALMLDAKQKRIYGAKLGRRDFALSQSVQKRESKQGEKKKTFPLVEKEPALFLAGIGKNCQIFADDPQSIVQYTKTGTKELTQYKIEKMPLPNPRCLYELALQKGGREKAGTWAELKPLYLRDIPRSFGGGTHWTQ